MADAKHTPGPWIYYADLPSTEPNWHIVTTANKMRVLANVHIEPGNAMDEANARLIAAAPDLLAASMKAANELRQAARALAKAGDHKAAAVADMAEERTRAAIAKATGAA